MSTDQVRLRAVIVTSPAWAVRRRSFNLPIMFHQPDRLGLSGFKPRAQEMERQHGAWLPQPKSWGTDPVIGLNPQISKKNLMFRKRYQPGKAVTPDGLAYLGASLGGLLSDHPKACYSIKARESI